MIWRKENNIVVVCLSWSKQCFVILKYSNILNMFWFQKSKLSFSLCCSERRGCYTAAAMSFHRRRYPYDNRLRRLLPLVFAVFLSLLILFAFLSFLAPFPGDSDRLPPRVRYSSNDAIKATGFRIPVSGFHYSSLKFETFSDLFDDFTLCKMDWIHP